MTEEFLQKYKELEKLIMERYSVGEGDSALWALGGQPEFVPFRSQLNAVREIRNFLSHTPSYDGRPLLVPTESAVKILNNIISKITGPSTIYNICIKNSGILTAKMDDQIRPVVDLMTDRGYRVVPIMDQGKVAGVFMDNAKLLSQIDVADPDSTFYQLKKHIDINVHINKDVLFMGKNTSIDSAKKQIADEFKKGNRIAAIFVTETGRHTEALIGLLLPFHLV